MSLSPEPDLSLTTVILLVLVSPLAIAGLMALYARWGEHKPQRRRLTDAEVRRIYKITAERARQGQWN